MMKLVLCCLLAMVVSGQNVFPVFPSVNRSFIQITTTQCTDQEPTILLAEGESTPSFTSPLASELATFGARCLIDNQDDLALTVSLQQHNGQPVPVGARLTLKSVKVTNLPEPQQPWETVTNKPYPVFQAFTVPTPAPTITPAAASNAFLTIKYNPALSIPNNVYGAKIEMTFDTNPLELTVSFYVARLVCNRCRFNLMLSSEHDNNPNTVPQPDIAVNGQFSSLWNPANTGAIRFNENAMISETVSNAYRYNFFGWLTQQKVLVYNPDLAQGKRAFIWSHSTATSQDYFIAGSLNTNPARPTVDAIIDDIAPGSSKGITAKVTVATTEISVNKLGAQADKTPVFYVEVECPANADHTAEAIITFTLTFKDANIGNYQSLPFRFPHICSPQQVTNGVFDLSTNGFFAPGLTDIADCGRSANGVQADPDRVCHLKVFDNGFVNPAFSLQTNGKAANGDPLVGIPAFRSIRSNAWLYAAFYGDVKDVDSALDWSFEDSVGALSPTVQKSCAAQDWKDNTVTYCKFLVEFGCKTTSAQKGTAPQAWTDNCYAPDKVSGLSLTTSLNNQKIAFRACKSCVVNPYTRLYADLPFVKTNSPDAGKDFIVKGQSAVHRGIAEAKLPVYSMELAQRTFYFGLWLGGIGPAKVNIDTYTSYDVDTVTATTTIINPDVCSLGGSKDCVRAPNATSQLASTQLAVNVQCHQLALTKIVVDVLPLPSGSVMDPTYSSARVAFWVRCDQSDNEFYKIPGPTEIAFPLVPGEAAKNQVPGCANNAIDGAPAHAKWLVDPSGWTEYGEGVVFFGCASDYKWNEASAAFMCGAKGWTDISPNPNKSMVCSGGPDDGGMSPAGVFFLVLFLITLTACMGGCAFKYNRQGARGLEMLPFVDTYRRVYNKAVGRSQMNYHVSHDQAPNQPIGTSSLAHHSSENATLDAGKAAGYGAL